MSSYYKKGFKKLLILFLKKLIALEKAFGRFWVLLKETARRIKEERMTRANEAERLVWQKEALKENFNRYSVIFWVKRKWARALASTKVPSFAEATEDRRNYTNLRKTVLTTRSFASLRMTTPWFLKLLNLLKPLKPLNRLNPVQRVVAALVIFALLWQGGLSALAQEGVNPLAVITTPEIKALESVNPELLKASSLEKEKEIQKAIEEEAGKVNYAFGGLVPDTEEDKLKKEEVGIVEAAKDALKGGIFTAPKPAEYTVIKFTKSRNPRVKQAALNAREILRAKGLYESFYDEQLGEESEISVDLETADGSLKPGKTPYDLSLGESFNEGMKVGDISDENFQLPIPNFQSIPNDSISDTDTNQDEESQPKADQPLAERTDDGTDENQESQDENQELRIENQGADDEILRSAPSSAEATEDRQDDSIKRETTSASFALPEGNEAAPEAEQADYPESMATGDVLD